MRHKSFLYAVMMLVLTALATSAYATRIFAGAECQLQDPINVSGLPEYGFGTILNGFGAPGDVNVVCPVVRDNTSNLNGTADFTVRVVSNGADFVLCSSYSVDEDGTLIDTVTASTNSNVPVTLNIDLAISANKGAYSMRCVLPPDSMIINYRLKEF
jgi:hypothetical protein